MIRAQIITHWILVDGASTPHFPPMNNGEKWQDITAQAVVPNSPNSVVIECVVDDTTLATIEADNDLYIIWSENV